MKLCTLYNHDSFTNVTSSISKDEGIVRTGLYVVTVTLVRRSVTLIRRNVTVVMRSVTLFR